MARIICVWLLCLSFSVSAYAQDAVSTALVHTNQTYVLSTTGKNPDPLQEYNVGDVVYVITGKKEKGYVRVTFDPTNLEGNGWIQENKIRIVSGYRSTDGKLPKEYQRKYTEEQPVVADRGLDQGDDLLSGEMTFIEELVTQEQASLESEFGIIDEDETGMQELPPLEGGVDGDNPFEEDLEFLFQDDAEFNETFETAKNEHQSSQVYNVGVSAFSMQEDRFATQVRQMFEADLRKQAKIGSISTFGYVENIETTNQVSKVSLSDKVSGVFFGILSPQVGSSRLLKVKFYDRALKQFLFEKVVNLSVQGDNQAAIENLARQAATFLKKGS
jgi:hypothetical protein